MYDDTMRTIDEAITIYRRMDGEPELIVLSQDRFEKLAAVMYISQRSLIGKTGLSYLGIPVLVSDEYSYDIIVGLEEDLNMDKPELDWDEYEKEMLNG